MPKNLKLDPWLPDEKSSKSTSALYGNTPNVNTGSLPNKLGDVFSRGKQDGQIPKRIKRGTIDPEHELTCPVNELSRLTQQLIEDFGSGYQVLPELVRRFSTAGFGKLLKVEIEKMGPCSQLPLFKHGKCFVINTFDN